MTSKYKHTHGTYKQLLENKDKILSNEIVIVDSGQPDTPSGSAVYYKTKDGEIIRLANESEIQRRDNTNMKDDTLAMELIKEQKTNSKRWFIAFLVVLGLLFTTIGGFIVYLSLPEEVTETTVDQQTDSGGDNHVVGGDYYSGSAENNPYNSPTEQTP